MTEGPEASFLAQYIYRRFKNKKLKHIVINDGRYKTHGPPHNFKQFNIMLPLKLTSIYKKGKVIFLIFENNWTIIVKFGMSGWFYTETDKPDIIKEPNITFEFENKNLYFTDFRNFGTLTFTGDIPFIVNQIDKLAPDILNNKTTFECILSRVNYLKDNNKNQTMAIEDALMEQTLIMSGIGNIIKSEVLYDSKIAPTRELKDLSEKDWRIIFYSAKRISKKILHHLDLRGLDLEEYYKLRMVYQKDFDSYGNKIHSHHSKLGRKTFWVPEIQK
jgi:formamidopyrimidine-DNA glycosylase